MERYSSADAFYESQDEWQEICDAIRDVLLSTELEETLKWYMPAYTYNGKNIIGVNAFKKYAGIWFHQGVFLTDPLGVLVNAQKGVTIALRQWRFTDISEVKPKLIHQYVREAIENCEQGLEIKPKRAKKKAVPPILIKALHDAKAKEAFDILSVSKRNEFIEYITSAKREETKMRRVEKIIPMILSKVGLNDKYKK